MTYIGNSRRNFLKTLTTTTLLSTVPVSGMATLMDEKKTGKAKKNTPSSDSIQPANLPPFHDGPASSLFKPVIIAGNIFFNDIDKTKVTDNMADAVNAAPAGECVAWGIPFNIEKKIILLKDKSYTVSVTPFTGVWITFLHTSDFHLLEGNKDGFYDRPFKGIGLLNDLVANYYVLYEDKSEEILPIRQRYQIGMYQQTWGENCIEAVAQYKPRPSHIYKEQPDAGISWGMSQTRVTQEDRGKWINWMWAWKNPRPNTKIIGFRFESIDKTPIIISAVSAGNVAVNPLKWEPRRKAVLTLNEGIKFNPRLNNMGLLEQIQLDMGQIISAVPRLKYPNKDWEQSFNNQVPTLEGNEVLIEYSAHPDAMFYLNNGQLVSKSAVEQSEKKELIVPVKTSDRKIKLKIVDKGSNLPVAVKFHAHGETDEYLVPDNRHRLPNDAWFEDYSTDFINQGTHKCTYIPGETIINLPSGKVYIEISKGFEIKPVRKVYDIGPGMDELVIEIEKNLHWREKGWVSADTHVHFLSPNTALLEGEAEGVNIVNLLASQWGELMTNVGDFDGKTTLGSRLSGGSGEYLVRVGTENRQHVMGHISLLGYEGNMITPMTTGGIDESAIGDPIEVLLTEWALQCKKQNGIVILPHFPNPRMENASAIVSGGIDGVEMTSWGDLYRGIDPYSLTDWYRYLNCGYFVAAVGGTDKMSADTAVGTVRTYAKIPDNVEFSFDSWKDSVRKGHTFVTYGPLVDFNVEGKPSGTAIEMPAGGGTVDITWNVASVTIPITRVELIINGEVKESTTPNSQDTGGSWKVKISKSSWLAILVRGRYPEKQEVIAAHTSPVMINVINSPMMAAADALTILDQIEGAMAYLDTIGTRAEDEAYKRMKMVLTSSHRLLHNRMHEAGIFHQHTPTQDHPEHH